jgi:hypothetical protein
MSYTGRHGPDSEFDRLEELSESSPEEFANLEELKRLNRERWHRRWARILRRRQQEEPTGDDSVDGA